MCKGKADNELKLSSPNVRVRVSFGGTSPRLRAIALDILGAVVPCPPPALNNSPRSAEGAPEAAPERALAALADGRLPAQSHRYTIKGLIARSTCVIQSVLVSAVRFVGWVRASLGRHVGGLVSE